MPYSIDFNQERYVRAVGFFSCDFFIGEGLPKICAENGGSRLIMTSSFL